MIYSICAFYGIFSTTATTKNANLAFSKVAFLPSYLLKVKLAILLVALLQIV